METGRRNRRGSATGTSTQVRPTIPPGEIGALVGVVKHTSEREERMRGDAGPFAIRGGKLAPKDDPAPAGGTPRDGGRRPLRPDSCLVDARVQGPRRLVSERVQTVAFDGRSPLGSLRAMAGPFSAEPVRQALIRIAPGPCAAAADDPPRLEAYLDPTRNQLDAARQIARDRRD